MTSDVLIIGGGVIGLAIAIELKLLGASVTVLCRDFTAAAATAAAGMLAPEAENILNPAMLSLCQKSRSLYPDWIDKLERLTSLNTGYWPCGILAPVYEQPEQTNPVLSVNQNRLTSPSYWLDQTAIHQYQPGLAPTVVGGWWYPEDGQVDNRALMLVLKAAAESLGVELKDGVKVEAIRQHHSQVTGVQTPQGVIHAAQYVLATGAWTNELFPLPVYPRKGQMLSVKLPDFLPELPLTRVLFGEDVYIVPRQNRSIIIGATNENIGFTAHNTPEGIHRLLQAAIRLYPQLQNYPIQELWWGFRPATADELPILGTSYCENLTLAIGHYRNGILLAPVTALLIANLIWAQKSEPLLANFHYSRFHTQSSSMPILSHITVAPTQHHNLSLNIQDSGLTIAGKTFHSRLMTGTGKYRSMEEMQQSIVDKNLDVTQYRWLPNCGRSHSRSSVRAGNG
jgi:thiazole synthase